MTGRQQNKCNQTIDPIRSSQGKKRTHEQPGKEQVCGAHSYWPAINRDGVTKKQHPCCWQTMLAFDQTMLAVTTSCCVPPDFTLIFSGSEVTIET